MAKSKGKGKTSNNNNSKAGNKKQESFDEIIASFVEKDNEKQKVTRKDATKPNGKGNTSASTTVVANNTNNNSKSSKSKSADASTQNSSDDSTEHNASMGNVIRIGLLAAMIIPFAIAYFVMGSSAFGDAVLNATSNFYLSHIFSFPSSSSDLAKWAFLMFTLSSPHIYYYIIWTNPKLWMSFCEKYNLGRPVKVYAYWAHAIKAQQTICLAWWYLDAINYTIPSSLGEAAAHISSHIASMNIIRLILAVYLMVLGQVFNVGVYQTIGESGVYYGIKFGEPVPWVYGFPFNVIGHPQYRGATISIWGILFFIATEVAVAKGLYAIGIVWTTYYYISGYVEEFM